MAWNGWNGWNGWLNLERFLNDGQWKCMLAPQFSQPYFKCLEANLQNECANGKVIFPPRERIFNALNLTPFETVKVVIIGQDPYHRLGQATGLAFSVPFGIPVPRSLRNIYKMLNNDPNIPGFVISSPGCLVYWVKHGMWIPSHGCLENWARQGVLLLNATLTVQAGDPESHAKFGWQYFTDEIIKIVSECHNHVVFILMEMLKEGIKDPAWQRVLEEEFRQPYFTELEEKLADEYDSGELIYPDKTRIFQAFNLTPFYEVRIVILGNEPYANATPISDYSQTVPKANGLAFSVPFEMSTIPRTLQNIYKELEHDIGFLIPTHGCLEKWAQEGVLLLNEKLTVRASMPKSHDNIGWQTFTDNVIKGVSDNLSHVVFLLWGNAGKRKEGLIDDSKHTVIKTDHPSDKQGDFHNSCCFSQSNFALVMKGQHPIDWTLRQETFDNVFI